MFQRIGDYIAVFATRDMERLECSRYFRLRVQVETGWPAPAVIGAAVLFVGIYSLQDNLGSFMSGGPQKALRTS